MLWINQLNSVKCYILIVFSVGTSGNSWVKHKIKDKYDYFYNIESKEGTWVEPDHFIHDSSQLTKEDIQVSYMSMFLIVIQKFFKLV